MRKLIGSVLFVVSVSVCASVFSSTSCVTSGTEYKTVCQGAYKYNCVNASGWDTPLWCQGPSDCGGSGDLGCYIGGPVFGTSSCMSTSLDTYSTGDFCG